MNLPPAFRKWLAFGSGVAIEIRGENLHVTAVRVRPSGVRVLAAAAIGQFRQRPAVEWGRVYADFARQAGISHLAAAVVLPRREVIVRVLHMPGVAERDLPSAIELQLESLHPFPENETLHSWARLDTPGAVLVGITRRETIEKLASLFAEAGIRIAAFTFSAAALYSASRLYGLNSRRNFVALIEREDGSEIYGESEARALFSAAMDGPAERGLALAASELRLPADTERPEITAVLGKPVRVPAEFDLSRNALVYSAALAGACPRLVLPVNLLPAERRVTNSRWLFAPTLALGVALVLVGLGLIALRPMQQKRYREELQRQIAVLEIQAKRAAAADRATQQARARAKLLDDFKSRSKADMDALNELTRILPPPTWLNSLDLTRTDVTIAGETDRAEGLLKIIDSSPSFKDSAFSMAPSKTSGGESFRIRARRAGAPQ